MALYLITNPNSNALGVYYLPLPAAQEELSLPAERLRRVLDAVCSTGFAEYSEEDSVIWVPNMAKYQIAPSLSPGDRRVVWARKELANFEGHPFRKAFLERYGEAYHLLPKTPDRSKIRLVRERGRGSQKPRPNPGAPQPSAERLKRAEELTRMLEQARHDG